MKMRKFLLTAIFAFVGLSAFGQERIAVFPFEDMDNVFIRNEASMFYSEFTNEFATRSAGRFTVVPRVEVERLINTEMAFQLSDFSAREKTAEMNRVLNGTRILSGKIARVQNNIRITVSLYTYPELHQLPGGATRSVSNTTELFNVIPELVRNMQANIAIGETEQSIPEGLLEESKYDWEDALARQVKFAEIYDNSIEVCVYHPSIPVNTHITLINLNNNRTIDVTVIGYVNGYTDHLYISGGVARLLGIYDSNTPISIEILGR